MQYLVYSVKVTNRVLLFVEKTNFIIHAIFLSDWLNRLWFTLESKINEFDKTCYFSLTVRLNLSGCVLFFSISIIQLESAKYTLFFGHKFRYTHAHSHRLKEKRPKTNQYFCLLKEAAMCPFLYCLRNKHIIWRDDLQFFSFVSLGDCHIFALIFSFFFSVKTGKIIVYSADFTVRLFSRQ